MRINKIHQIDALEGLKQLPDNFIDCVMCSPPYWALRDYGTKPQIWGGDNNCEHSWGDELPEHHPGQVEQTKWKNADAAGMGQTAKSGNFCSKCSAWKGSLGLEPTFDLYIKHLCDIFDDVKRVLKKEGTCWINLGDTYGGSGNASGHTEETMNLGYTTSQMGATKGITSGLMPKSLTLIPFRFAIEMINRGWILRNTIIWQKPNCMPSSAKDRFTVDFEYLFFFVKNKKYFFEQQYEEHKRGTPESERDYKRMMVGRSEYVGKWGDNNGTQNPFVAGNPLGRNKRTVWSICPQPFPEAHFAVYPEKLCETPLKSGCPEFICVKCGKARAKIIEDGEDLPKGGGASLKYANSGLKLSSSSILLTKTVKAKIDKGYTNCNCNAGFIGGIVLDPFIGVGTTALVALKQSKRFIGFEINKEYIKIANKRIKPYLDQKKLIVG